MSSILNMFTTITTKITTTKRNPCSIVFLLFLFFTILPSSYAQEYDEDGIIIEEATEESTPVLQSTVFWLVFFIVCWSWKFGREIAIYGLDSTIRKPTTLIYIGLLMYVIAWGAVELAMHSAGGYNPQQSTFGYDKGNDIFLNILLLLVISLTLILWLSCWKCSERYSEFSISKKLAKTKATNPYDRSEGLEKKAMSSLVRVLFCTCGEQASDTDGIDNEEVNGKDSAIHLVPPPPPTNAVYEGNAAKLQTFKEEEKKYHHDHDLLHKLKHEAKRDVDIVKHSLIRGEKEVIKSMHNMENKAHHALVDAELNMEKANGI